MAIQIGCVFPFESRMSWGRRKPRKMFVRKIIFLMACDEPFSTSCPFSEEEEMWRMQQLQGSYLHPGPWKITEQILLKDTFRPMRDMEIHNSHHYHLCPICLPFVLIPVDKGKAVDVPPDLHQKQIYGVDGYLQRRQKPGWTVVLGL